MAEQIIKSKDRVKSHGEVFTPRCVVDFMLNQPEIREKINSLTATFLEPAAGEGAFLVEILHRKLQRALDLSGSMDEYGENCLIALSSLYGIELLEDNCKWLRWNMNYEFHAQYGEGARQKFSAYVDGRVIKCANTVIQANMVQGDALKYTNSLGEPIVVSEWKLLPQRGGRRKVQRIEHTLEDIVNENTAPNDAVIMQEQEINLFAEEVAESKKLIRYAPVNILDIYKQLVEDVQN